MQIKNILVRAPNWIGDIMLATPALNSLRNRFPSAKISVLIQGEMSPLLENNPDLDELIPCLPKKSSLWSRLFFYHRLSSRRFDLAILLTNSFESALAAFLCNAAERVGYSRDMRRLLLTTGITTPPREYPRMHQSEYYLNLIRKIGGKDCSKKVTLQIPCEISESADRLWQEEGLNNSSFTVGFGAAASFGSAKMWPPERFSELGDKIMEKFNGRVVVFGGKQDIESARFIVHGMKREGVSMAGKTNLKSLAAMIRRCHLYITNDSGPMHIAAAVGTPIIGIFGSTDPSETSPLSDSYIIVRNKTECSPCWKRECTTDHSCMKTITVEDVMRAVAKFWKARGDKC